MTTPQPQDEPRISGNVGTEVLFENDRIRVWEMRLGPGQSSELHRHVHDYVFVYVTPTLLESREPGGKPRVRSFEDGFVQHTVVGREGKTHRVRNAGDVTHRQIIVELLGPTSAEDAPPPETNGRVVEAPVGHRGAGGEQGGGS